MALKNQVAVDARLMYDHQTQVLTEGSNQVSARRIASTQCNNNVISFDNLLSIGENSVIDPNVFIEYTVAITGSGTTLDILCPPMAQATIAGGATVWSPALAKTSVATRVDVIGVNGGGAYVPVAGNTIVNPNMIFAQYPLSSVCNNLSVSINNVNTSINLANIVSVLRENLLSDEKRNQVGSMVPCDLNRSPLLLPQYTTLCPYGTPNQPNTPVQDSNQRSRICVESVITAQTCTYTIREPVFIAPFQLSKNAHGLCNVNSLSIRFQLDASKNLLGMFNSTQDNTDAFITATKVNITGAQLIINYLSVDVVEHPIPSVAFYDYCAHEVNLTTFGLGTINGDVQKAVSCSAFKLTTIPKFYWIKAQPSVNGLLPKNLVCGFPIETLQINYGSYGIYIFNRSQLWLAYCRNTQQTNLSYHQWVALGTPVCLQPSLDMSSASSFAGVDGIGGIMMQTTVSFDTSNYNNVGLTNPVNSNFDPLTCQVVEIYVLQGSLAIGNGSAVFKNSTVNMATFDELGANRVAVSDAVVANSQGSGESGGGFGWGSVKGLLSSGAKSLGKLAVQHGPDLARKGAEYGLGKLQEHLDGGAMGESAGGMGVSGGKYSRRR
jgi:hypothetical protein